MQTYPHQLFIGPRVPALDPEDLETTSFYILFCLSFFLFGFSVCPSSTWPFVELVIVILCVKKHAIPSLLALALLADCQQLSSTPDPPRYPHFSHRVRLAGMKISRPPTSVGHYKMVKHRGDKGNEENPHR